MRYNWDFSSGTLVKLEIFLVPRELQGFPVANGLHLSFFKLCVWVATEFFWVACGLQLILSQSHVGCNRDSFGRMWVATNIFSTAHVSQLGIFQLHVGCK
jgi:hypothetical protein